MRAGTYYDGILADVIVITKAQKPAVSDIIIYCMSYAMHVDNPYTGNLS